MIPKLTNATKVLLVAILVLVPSSRAAGESPSLSAEEGTSAIPDEIGAASPALPAGWSSVAVVPWGAGAGKLAEQIHSAGAEQVYHGPTRFLVLPDGGFAVLDVLGNEIEEFDGAGKPVRCLSYPGGDGRDGETSTIDMAAVSAGEYWLLDLGQQAVVHLKADDPNPRSFPIEGLKSDSLLTGLATDGRGNVYILDSSDNTVFTMTVAGETAPSFRHDAASSLAVDPAGRFYDLSLASQSDARHWSLVRLTPPSELDVLGEIETRLETSHLDVFGLDAAGNVHVTMYGGAIEHPTTVEVVRFAPDGKETGRVACPPDPIELEMIHGKAVAPDGTLYAVVVRTDGLEILEHAPIP